MKGENQISNTDLRSPTSDLWCHAGKGAKAAVYSFNGNKIITTSGGGMLASDDEALIAHAKKLSQQAREDFPHYEHVEIGYNYRMSNVLAAIGRGQLRLIEERVRRKREIFDYYQAALGDLPGIEFMPEPDWSRANRWLTVVLITPEMFGADPSTIFRTYGASREDVRLALEAENIEARPVWKPMHMQPVFQSSRKGAKTPREEQNIGRKKVQMAQMGGNNTQHSKPKTTHPGLLGVRWRRICLRGGCVCRRGRRWRIVIWIE